MSSLIQFRLLSLSRGCISITAKRYDSHRLLTSDALQHRRMVPQMSITDKSITQLKNYASSTSQSHRKVFDHECCKLLANNRKQQKHQGDQNNGSPPPPPPPPLPPNGFGAISTVTMLGILGVFKKSLSDIEEEKAKLADEKKIEKMKPIEIKIAKGVLSMCDQDYIKANVLFHEALHIAQDENDDVQENMILNLIAANYFESGDFTNAERLFIDLMKRMIADEVPATAPAILELSLKLASIYSKNPDTHEKAFKGFKFVINSLLSNLDDVLNSLDTLDIHELSEEKRNELALLGWSYDWFGKHLLLINDYHNAVDMLKRALNISAKVLGPQHDQTLILFNDVGTTLAMDNLPEEGLTYILKAVEGAIQSESKELASFYINLGLVNLKLNNLNEAKRYCEYSIELAGKNNEHYNSSEVIELSRTCLNEVKRLLTSEKQ